MQPQFNQPAMARYSDRPLPSYRHLPFQNAHPFLDEGGHCYGEKLSPPESFTPENWQNCVDYLYCIDLFNYGFWWEAHERLKQICFAAGRESELGQFLQGLIQVAAALLKHFMGEDRGAKTLADLGLKNLQISEGFYLGIEISTLVVQVENCMRSRGAVYPQIELIK
jgi:predicted metal-dependent hydrolase